MEFADTARQGISAVWQRSISAALSILFLCPHFLNRDSPDEGMARIGAADRAAAFSWLPGKVFCVALSGLACTSWTVTLGDAQGWYLAALQAACKDVYKW